MCEAMSSGLVPITLYNTAIPEYLPDDKNLICHNVDDMLALAIKLINDKELFVSLSKKCSEFINNNCSYEKILKEVQLFKVAK